MKNTMYKLFFFLCLFVSASCSQENQEGGDTTGTTESTADTTATNDEVSNEVPKGLEAH